MIRDLWIFLFSLGFILFSWPIISMFTYDLSIYLFIAWFIFIALIFIANAYARRKDDGG